MKYSKLIMLYGLAFAFLSCGIFKKPQDKKVSVYANAITQNVTDTSKKAVQIKLKPYDEVITSSAVSSTGLFKVHRIEDKYFFEIPDSLLEADLLIVNRIAKGATGASMALSGYGGDQINENVVRFSKGPNSKLFMKSISYTERSSDSTDNGMYRSVRNSSLQPIIAAFEIKAISKDSTALVIEITDYLNADNDILFFNTKAKGELKIGSLQADKSYINAITTYRDNIEIKTIRTYSKSAGGNATFELNSSIIHLPKIAMVSRDYDARVGYFSTSYIDFDRNPQGVSQRTLITRWRLEPKAEDEVKYLRGELVEPKKQIVFYVDPTTPKKWQPYLIQGVNDWKVAFEAAGFKNAIVAKEAPSKEQDSTWNIESARQNVIVYKPSAVTNASGPHVHDPRTGEILETHINWYHNIMQVLRNWYFIQASAVDQGARKMKFDDELMGQLIRFVASHEVGHTLGLRHNFGSSSTVPVEKLRDKAWVEANGHTPSIMDYARFNYVAQPEDGISEKGIFPRIGDYDKWAIEWGYRWWPTMPKVEEETKLNQWIIERTAKNKRLWFGEESDPDDPRCQSEDLGDNAMTAGTYGIKNLKRIMSNIIGWSKVPNESFTDANDMYRELLMQFGRYMKHVSKNIGGIITTPKKVEERGALVEYVNKTKQKEAMLFLQEQLFNTPTWLLRRDIFDKTGSGSILTISRQQDVILADLLSANTLFKLLQFEGFNPTVAYKANEMLNDLQVGIFKELKAGQIISIYRRSLQKSYTEKLMALLMLSPAPPSGAFSPPDFKNTDIPSIVRMQLIELHSQIKLALPKSTEKITRAHLQDIAQRIEQTLKIKNSLV